MKNPRMLTVVVLALVLMLGCAPGPNQLTNSPSEDGKVAGFWHGLWHGFIALFTFIISLFSDSVRMYEVHNNGNWYNLGFLLGAMIFFGGGCGGGSARRRSRRR
jgi:hypothetical protein